MQQRKIQMIGFRIRTRTIVDCMQIFGFDGFESDSATFLVSLQYAKNAHSLTNPDLTAFIHDVRSGTTNQRLSGTEIVLLIHHILLGIGVKSSSLHNAAKLRYNFWGHRKFIPLICLRCIRGKTSDWYSDFGYFNINRKAIASEMAKIHDTPYQGSTFGPWLHALWNQSDITDFHMAYQNNLWRFTWLKKLRDTGDWIVVLNENTNLRSHADRTLILPMI